MITKNKLSGHPNARPTEHFNTGNISSKSSTKNIKKFLVLLIGILLLVAGATFGVISMLKNPTSTDAPADEILAPDDSSDKTPETMPDSKNSGENSGEETTELVNEAVIETITVPIAEATEENATEPTAETPTETLNEN